MALRFKDCTFNSSGHRVENCFSRYSFLNDERDGAIFIFKDKEFSHSEVYFTVKDLWSPMGVLQRGQKVKLM